MVDPAGAFAAFQRHGVAFWTGVPDSLLKDFCLFVDEHSEPGAHVIAANEGGAVALAAGQFLATGAVAGVYFQNSGLGNAVNPLVSLADPTVSGIPMVLLIGWRGRPGVADEPQHGRQGEAMLPLLEAIAVPALVAPREDVEFEDAVQWVATKAQERHGPSALVVEEGTFGAYAGGGAARAGSTLPSREDALVEVVRSLPARAAIVSTTGKTSRELYEYRRRSGAAPQEFLTVGAMGHASQIALGVALAQPSRPVCVLDGDGAALMHLGAFAVIGQHSPANLLHVLFNNHAHESVGGQPTPSSRLDFPALAAAAGYRTVARVSTVDEIRPALSSMAEDRGPSFLEIEIRVGSRGDLGRPSEPPSHNRDAFMAWLRE